VVDKFFSETDHSL